MVITSATYEKPPLGVFSQSTGTGSAASAMNVLRSMLNTVGGVGVVARCTSPVQILFAVTATPFGTRPSGMAARRVTVFESGFTSTMARAVSEPLKFPEQTEYR